MSETLYLAYADGERFPVDASESGLEGYQLNMVRLENELYSARRLSSAEANGLRDIYLRSQEKELSALLSNLEWLLEHIAIDCQNVDFRTWAMGKTVCLPCLDPDLLMTTDEQISDAEVEERLKNLFERNLRGIRSHIEDKIISTPVAKDIARDALLDFMLYLSIAYDKLHGITRPTDVPDWFALRASNLIDCVSYISLTIGNIQGFIEYGYKRSGRPKLSKDSEFVQLARQVIKENPRASKSCIISLIRARAKPKRGQEPSESTARKWFDVATE